jgi:hypothetical protein
MMILRRTINMKIIKFRSSLKENILKGKKDSTWRLFDDKNLSKGDKISLVEWESGKEFAKGIILEVKEKQFHQITKKDRKGHERFKSDDQMYKTYSTYYKKRITPYTKIKIIKLKLINA